LETNDLNIEDKYHSKLTGDTGLIIGMLALLIGVEGFVLYKILIETWTISGSFSYLYLIFVGLIVTVETIGCMSVRNSIRTHMFEFKYYD
jgi:hypothetical protein